MSEVGKNMQEYHLYLLKLPHREWGIKLDPPDWQYLGTTFIFILNPLHVFYCIIGAILVILIIIWPNLCAPLKSSIIPPLPIFSEQFPSVYR